MFKEIFNGGNLRRFGMGGNLLQSESLIEMHYISRTGSLDIPDTVTNFEWDDEEGEDSAKKRWNEDPLSGRLSAVDAALATLPCHLIDRHYHWVTTLDLTRNHIEDPDFIVYFERLETLILDHNRLSERVVFPKSMTLTTLWLNFNQIGNLYPFADSLADSFPRLNYLSMMGNPAAPSFVNDGKFHDYVVYRLYLVSRVTTLAYLDDRKVEGDEKLEAKTMYEKTPSQIRISRHFSPIEAGHPVPAVGHEPEVAIGAKIKRMWEDKVMSQFR